MPLSVPSLEINLGDLYDPTIRVEGVATGDHPREFGDHAEVGPNAGMVCAPPDARFPIEADSVFKPEELRSISRPMCRARAMFYREGDGPEPWQLELDAPSGQRWKISIEAIPGGAPQRWRVEHAGVGVTNVALTPISSTPAGQRFASADDLIFWAFRSRAGGEWGQGERTVAELALLVQTLPKAQALHALMKAQRFLQDHEVRQLESALEAIAFTTEVQP